jgi:hypothetical protein
MRAVGGSIGPAGPQVVSGSAVHAPLDLLRGLSPLVRCHRSRFERGSSKKRRPPLGVRNGVLLLRNAALGAGMRRLRGSELLQQ